MADGNAVYICAGFARPIGSTPIFSFMTVESKTICDICGKEINSPEAHFTIMYMGYNSYDADFNRIPSKALERFRDLDVDVCEQCHEKVGPALIDFIRSMRS